ncbi:MAG: histidine kinase [Coprococcus sp.]|nr:histidine kinase [Coprococcus sp.]
MGIEKKSEKSGMSLKKIIYLGMIGMVILLFGFCTFFMRTVWTQLNRHETSVYMDMLKLQVQTVENEIAKMQNDLVNFTVTDENFLYIRHSRPDEDREFQRLQVNSHLREYLNTYSYVNGLFIIDERNQKIMLQYDNDSDYTDMQEVRDYLEEQEGSDGKEGRLKGNFLAYTGETCRYFYILPMGDLAVGGWCDLEKWFPFIFQEGDEYPFLGIGYALDEESFMKNSVQADCLKAEVTGETTGMNYILYLSREEVASTVFRLMGWDVLASVLIFAVAVGILLWVSRGVLSPVSYMEKELEIIGRGNLDHRLKRAGELKEFQALYRQFNEMLDQVNHLKIQVYEEQMAKKEIYTAYLTMQMNPHFYVNSLNVIHSLAGIKNYVLIEKMTGCLSDYLNYMFRKEANHATLAEELRHVANFVEIQKIRYAENFGYVVEVEERATDARIPILLLHTFVENSIKYSKTEVEDLRIHICITWIEDGQISVVCTDNGKGFDEKALEEINGQRRIIKADGEHIGIRNLWERADIFYEGRFSLECYNQAGSGACVKMVFPYVTEIN